MKPDEAVLIAVPGGTEASFPPRDFDVLFADEHERLYRGLLFITGSRTDAEELMQDAFLKLWERWDRVGSIEDPVAYLFRIALNGSRMRARRAMRLSSCDVTSESAMSPGYRSASMRSRVDGTLPKMMTALMNNTVPITTGTTHAARS